MIQFQEQEPSRIEQPEERFSVFKLKKMMIGGDYNFAVIPGNDLRICVGGKKDNEQEYTNKTMFLHS